MADEGCGYADEGEEVFGTAQRTITPNEKISRGGS